MGLVSAATLGVVFGALWQQGPLKRWLQARAVAFYLKQVQPHLPFEIEEIEADAPLDPPLFATAALNRALDRFKLPA